MNFNFDSLMDTITNLRERGAEYANVAMDKTKNAEDDFAFSESEDWEDRGYWE